MNYVDAGYVVGLATLAVYGLSLVVRTRSAQRRLLPIRVRTRESRVSEAREQASGEGQRSAGTR